MIVELIAEAITEGLTLTDAQALAIAKAFSGDDLFNLADKAKRSREDSDIGVGQLSNRVFLCDDYLPSKGWGGHD
jgi:hypothetical protein